MLSISNKLDISSKSVATAAALVPETLHRGFLRENLTNKTRRSDEPRVSSDLNIAHRREIPKPRASIIRSIVPSPPDFPKPKLSGVEPAARLMSKSGFKTGDMVWGKVESHPWWPGQIFDEAFGQPSVMQTKKEGHLLVAFFGDGSYGWFDPAELIPFDPHFVEKSRQTSSGSFVNAVKEAMDEVSRRGAIALTCHCRKVCNLRPMNSSGFVAADVAGYEPGGIYSVEQIKAAKERFVPVELVSFLHQFALIFCGREPWGVDWIKCKGMLIAYRQAAFEEFDETYHQAFDVQLLPPSKDVSTVKDHPEKVVTPACEKDPSTKRKRYLLTSGLQKPPPTLQPVNSISTRQAKTSQELPIRRAKSDKWTLDRRVGNVADHSERGIGILTRPICEDSEDQILGRHNRSFMGARVAMRPSPLNIDRMVKNVKVPTRPRSDVIQTEKTKTEVKEAAIDVIPNCYPCKDEFLPARNDYASLGLGFPQLIRDLRVLAVEPSHGVELNLSSVVICVFLKFRSLVYLKSLVPPPKQVADPRELPSIQLELIQKPDDSSMTGRKRVNCNRLEQWPMTKTRKSETGSNQFHWYRNPSIPTFLLMKFPSQTMMPSRASLEAKFSRFGPLDRSGTHVYWPENLCKVLFKSKIDARVAHNYAMSNTNLFGRIKVDYLLREAEPWPPSPFPQRSQASIPNTPNYRRKDFGDVVGIFGCSSTKEVNRVDVSLQLLGLLLRCSEIVAGIQFSLGYLPLRPL